MLLKFSVVRSLRYRLHSNYSVNSAPWRSRQMLQVIKVSWSIFGYLLVWGDRQGLQACRHQRQALFECRHEISLYRRRQSGVGGVLEGRQVWVIGSEASHTLTAYQANDFLRLLRGEGAGWRSGQLLDDVRDERGWSGNGGEGGQHCGAWGGWTSSASWSMFDLWVRMLPTVSISLVWCLIPFAFTSFQENILCLISNDSTLCRSFCD